MIDDPERALAESASWTNVDACCRESLELARLEVGLRRVMREPEPAPELDAAILRAAAARKSSTFAGVAGAAAAPIESVPTAGGFIRRLRQWVTAPQVAMATITALAVVLGVFYFPSQRPKMEAAGDTVMGVPTAASPEPQVATASPSDMGPSNAPAFLPPKPEGSASALPTAASAGAANERMQLAQADMPTDERARLMANAQIPADDPHLDLDGVARQEAQGHGAGRAGETGDMLALAEQESAPSYEAYAPAPSPMRSTSRQTEAPSSLGGATPMPPATTSPTTAGAPLTTPGTVAPDLLTQARALRARGQCAAAIPLYDRYVSEGGAARGDALIEEAQCLAQTGHTDRARQLYQRATAIPSVASRARSGLDSLGTTASSATASRAPAATTTMTETRARAGATGSAEHAATATDSAADAFDSH